MGFNYRKSKNIGKGFRINMTQNGPGLSFGKKGIRVTVNKKGVRGSVGIPGSGMSYSKQKSFPRKYRARRITVILSWILLAIVAVYWIITEFL
ncbi:DUF4236 domain-containing protein [Anaerovorax odorimutans]|uniref:DUF4236 domain-containing protein n=1 Tax=Anaerovorax odorimutans TaxID=109327 RepID=UPI00042A4444|nr:DUF4236 domain-containing protein [Anaerovorax odorimutans]